MEAAPWPGRPTTSTFTPPWPAAQVLRLVLQGDIVPLHDERILSEYRQVLSRSTFDFDPEDVGARARGHRVER